MSDIPTLNTPEYNSQIYIYISPAARIQGGSPEPWELAIGGTTKRVSRQGRAVVDYAAKMNALGVDERSLAGDVNPIADHVASIGRGKMRLVPSDPIPSGRKVAPLGGT